MKTTLANSFRKSFGSCVFALSFIFCCGTVSAQLTQNVRGTVIDEASNAPIPGAKIEVFSDEKSFLTRTDFDGDFIVENVPIGRITLTASFVGYETQTLTNLDLISGKELILSISLVEKLTETEEVTITGVKSGEVSNEMASVSARTFSVEASQRYAGSVNDVARMAQNFAGVQGNDDSRNDIIVRGNSPIGVLYRYEGVDIPNPNHFALLGTAGGPVSILNNNVLANSDFFTGAFPAEYGNALAAVFDLKMRNGNNSKHEFLGQVGFNGAELLAEGPINKSSKSSYLISYRYSTLRLFSLAGINFGTGIAVPDYQDVNFKLNFPNKKGSTSIFGLGGLSNVNFEGDPENDAANLFADNLEDLSFRSRIGVIGIKNIYRINDKTFLKTTISTSGTLNNILRDTLVAPDFEREPSYRNLSLEGKNNINTQINYKHNAKNLFRVGLVADRLFFDLADSLYLSTFNQWFLLTDYSGSAFVWQPFAQWQHKINNKLTLNTGLHYQLFSLNNSQTLEPRLGVVYKAFEAHSFSLGYGKHSQVPPTRIYFRQVFNSDGTPFDSPNQGVGMTNAHHFVLSHNYRFGKNWQLKSEVYYQHLNNVPIDVQNNTYSLLNFGANFDLRFPDSLVNGGTGTNYGFEVTLEHFMTKGFYLLFTSSIYSSKFVGSNGQEFGTAFNGNYTVNFLAGKEWTLKSKKEDKRNSLTVDIRLGANGGQRHTPVLEEASQQTGFVVFDESRTNELQYPMYFRTDLRIAYKVSSKKFTQEWAIDFRNLTNHQNIFTKSYNIDRGEYDVTYQIGFLPIGQWRISF